MDGGKAEAEHGFAQNEESGQGERGAIGRHAGQGAQLGQGERKEAEDERFEVGERKGKAGEAAGFEISATKKTSVGVAGTARESGLRFAGWGGDF